MVRRVLLVALCALLPQTALAEEPASTTRTAHLSRFGAGAGPAAVEGGFRLLDAERTKRQSNAVAFDRTQPGAYERIALTCRMRVLEGGDGGAFLFLATSEYGERGSAPFVPSWVEPNVRGSFAVGVDVHNPPSKETFTSWGNYENRPEREISLSFDGREIVKRVAPAAFRGAFADVAISMQHVVGGAEITVEIGGQAVYERYFIADLLPYECRLAIGAGTRSDATTAFDVQDIVFAPERPAVPRRPPLHVEVFNHVLTDNQHTAYAAEVSLPPVRWAFDRVILTLEIHDAGKDWDEWDRNGEVSVWDDAGTKLGIVPFITSYRTPCLWKVDVTHFRPLLAGKRKIEIAAGTGFYKNRGFMLSVSLDFHHRMASPSAEPALEPCQVVPIWVGTAHYKSAENHYQDFFTPRTVSIPEGVVGGRVFCTTTGHSQIGEFTPSKRTLVFAPEQGADPATERRFENVLWKTDCYLNPNRPQFGTWQFSRAGWAPGDVVRPWRVDLTPYLKPGGEAELRYETEPYAFGDADPAPSDKQVAAASQVVRAYLVLYCTQAASVPAPTLRISNVAGGSNAATAGLKAGDYLARYDGKLLNSVDDLRAAIQAAAEAGTVEIGIVAYRGAERLELHLAPGRMGIDLASR